MGKLQDIKKLRGAVFLFTILLHALFIFFLAFNTEAIAISAEPVQIMRLMDIEEYVPLPPPPPPPPPEAVEPQQNIVEAIAENMIETDNVPEDQIVVDFIAAPVSQPAVYVPAPPETLEFIPQSRVSRVPTFSDQDLRRITTFLRERYPTIALRSGIEGTVILELFIDARGVIRQINILRETPEGHGFGEVAVNAFREIQAVPAEADGHPVAVRFRYPIRFTIR